MANWETTYLKESEVVVHNTENDCWLTWHGVVRDLTPLVKDFEGTKEIRPIIAFAGKDISHWFDKNGEIRHYIHPLTGILTPYLPHGPLPHLCEFPYPSGKWFPPPRLPWWKDSKYNVGRLTKNCRPVRIMNMGFGKEVLINVCEEYTLTEILKRYRPFNENATNYTWKFETRKLDMNKTMTENQIPDKREYFRQIGLPDDLYVPCIQLYYDDDMGEGTEG